MEEKPPPMGVAVGPLDGNFVCCDRVEGGFREDLAVPGVSLSAALEAVPLEGAAGLRACGFDDADHGGGDLGADAVAGDEGDLVRGHCFSPGGGTLPANVA